MSDIKKNKSGDSSGKISKKTSTNKGKNIKDGTNQKPDKKKSLVPQLLIESRATGKVIKKEESLTAIKNIPPAEDLDEDDISALERGDNPMSLVDHLSEFRNRLIYCLLSVFFILVIGFILSDPMLHYISSPFLETGQKLNIFKLTGGFMIRIKASLICSILLSLPLIIYQIWKFIAPAISMKERKFSIKVILSAVLLFYGGMAFVFFIILPNAIPMLLGFIGHGMESKIGADDYLSFVLFLSLLTGFFFELPLIIMILTRIGIITPAFLISKRKYAIVLIWIIAAVITPPDIFTQFLIAIPLMLLYEISVAVSKIVILRKKGKGMLLEY